MNRLYVLVAGAGAVVALAAGCSSSTKNSIATPPSSPPSSSPAPASSARASGAAATVKTSGSAFGQILTDGSGHTLYLFKADTGTTPTCTGACATLWPADITNGAPQAGSGVSSTLLGTTTRPDDHKSQVTVDGHPLYFSSKDTKAGDVNGQGFGGLWFVVSPTGVAITTMHTSSTPTPMPAKPMTPMTPRPPMTPTRPMTPKPSMTPKPRMTPMAPMTPKPPMTPMAPMAQ